MKSCLACGSSNEIRNKWVESLKNLSVWLEIIPRAIINEQNTELDSTDFGSPRLQVLIASKSNANFKDKKRK